MYDLTGKVAFITGAARGQGRSHAIRLAEDGADIIAIDACADIPNGVYPGATEADLAETVRQVEALDRRIIATKADVRDLAALQAAVDDGVAELGRLDIVCANAGIVTRMAPADEFSEGEWSDMVDVNLSGVWRTARAAIPHLKATGPGGSLILTSSSAGLIAYANTANYTAAKHGVVGLMRALALELGPFGIRVNSVHPTQVDTDMIMHDSMYKLWRPDLEHPTRETFAEASQTVHALPVPWVEARDVSAAVAFLASDEARYITGITLPIDAGVTIK